MASFVQKGALAYDGEGFHGFCRTKIRGFVRQMLRGRESMLHRRESPCVLRKQTLLTPVPNDVCCRTLFSGLLLIAVEKNFVILRMIMSAHTFNNCHLGQYGEYVSYTEVHKKTTWRHNENGAYAGTGNH